MMLRGFLVLACLSVISYGVFGKPTYKSGIKTCYKEKCPEDTYACERLSRVSQDRKYIENEIHCLGLKGKVLSNVTISTGNPFGQALHFQGYSYTGSISYSSDNDSDCDQNNNSDTEEVEPEAEVNQPKPNRVYSEVDDLNNSNTEERLI